MLTALVLFGFQTAVFIVGLLRIKYIRRCGTVAYAIFFRAVLRFKPVFLCGGNIPVTVVNVFFGVGKFFRAAAARIMPDMRYFFYKRVVCCVIKIINGVIFSLFASYSYFVS